MALTPPADGQRIKVQGDQLAVPDRPIIPVIVGDGTGPDIMAAALPVLQAAVKKAYGGRRELVWFPVPAGEGAIAEHKDPLPPATLDAIRTHLVALKGPLTTPVGTGFRSVNVGLRQALDLYACVRPVYYIPGVPAPVKEPEAMDLVIFRENLEDVYAGVEFAQGTPEQAKLRTFLIQELKVSASKIREDAGIGIKPMSAWESKRLVRKAIRYALAKGRRSVTIVHKGNIMKFTEGAFKDWGYQVAQEEEFRGKVITEQEVAERHGGKPPAGLVVIKDRIADNMFQQLLTKTHEYDVLATPNLHGDLLSDAAAGQIGGLGLAPGGNIGDFAGVFEATHGTAPKYAGKDVVNPSSVILSGVMMLEHLGWDEAALLVKNAVAKTIAQRKVTYDLAREMEGVEPIKCSAFGNAIVANL
ncbi:MAG TPA: isocitrate dehydrogenase (NADP(+)) [Candidatus Thermoplasmatota archaeon]|jgi:isocitrate dehydrogenase|nr:isocitrate dehydrogenase (NADP(+)) [Candidatus Thermoplasmatota archaeon]